MTLGGRRHRPTASRLQRPTPALNNAAVAALIAADFNDGESGGVHGACEPSAVGAGAFYTDSNDVAVGAEPADQHPVAGWCGRERLVAEVTAEGIDHGGDMEVGVSVDSAGHLELLNRVRGSATMVMLSSRCC